jgi:hypothetical protein
MGRILRHRAGWLTLVAFLASLALPLAARDHFNGDDDVDCGSGALVLYGAPSFRTPAAPVQSEHCALCHWQRTVRTAAASPLLTVVRSEEIVATRGFDNPRSVVAAPPDRKSSRAPPADLVG